MVYLCCGTSLQHRRKRIVMKSLEDYCTYIIDAFLQNGYLQKKSREWYIYTLQRWFLRVVTVCLFFTVNSLIWGILPTAAFYFSFLAIRSRAGGFHASTPTKCMLLSFVVSFVGIGLSVHVAERFPIFLIVSINIASFFLIRKFCVGGSSDYTEYERKANKKIAERTTFLCSVLSTELAIFPLTVIFGVSMCSGIFIAAMAAIPRK